MDAPAASRLAPNLDLQFCYGGRNLPYLDENGCVPVRTNSLGFRDDEFAREKPDGETRVLAVGDSFTFGHGVRAEDGWVERLEDALETRLGTVQVINGGFATGAHRTADYTPWIAQDGLALDPDLVIIGLCLNDIGEFPMAVAAPPVESPWLGGASHVLTAIQERRQREAFEAQPLPDAAILLDLVPEPWLETQAALRTMRDLCAEQGAGFLVVVFPMFFRLERERYPFLEVHARIDAFCTEAGIDHVDLYPVFEGRDDRSLWVHPSDQHANPRGHALIAESLLPEVVQLLER